VTGVERDEARCDEHARAKYAGPVQEENNRDASLMLVTVKIVVKESQTGFMRV